MKEIRRTPIVQQVVDSILEYIAQDGNDVGDKLPTERELCEQLNVGRSTLREAIRILQARGYVESRPGKGAFIASKSGHNMADAAQWISEHKVTLRDFMEVRRAIEELSVRLAIERASDEDVRALIGIHENFLDAVDRSDTELAPQLDAEFHNQIAMMTHNELLISVSGEVAAKLTAFRGQTFRIPRNMHNAVEPHKAIVAAFLDRDVERGVYEMHLHQQKVFEDMENDPTQNGNAAH